MIGLKVDESYIIGIAVEEGTQVDTVNFMDFQLP
jgi:hypothetical protein